MTMPINQLMLPEGAQLYYTESFRAMLETHMTWLRSRPTNTIINIDPHDAYKYEADLTGLLRQYSIQDEYHYVVMRMNDLTSVADYRQDLLQMVVPDRGSIERLRTVFMTTSGKIN